MEKLVKIMVITGKKGVNSIVSIPQELMEKYNLKVGDKVQIFENEDKKEIIIKKL
jgi:bifunctional DNA-binding transcriptional regulator/antitoxin component of YhaV-PrlF toxin-antitoxin module